jgi:hypothetical protein
MNRSRAMLHAPDEPQRRLDLTRHQGYAPLRLLGRKAGLWGAQGAR